MTSVFDLHDEAYYVWRDAGVRNAVLVHVDGHHDAEAAVPSGLIGIGNYVRAAFEAGIVARVHWVAPDQMWNDPERRALIQRVLAETAPVPIETGPIAALRSFPDPVLLDVDVDYFFTIGYGRDPVSLRLSEPWRRPTELAEALRGRCPRRLVTTIATSITGCFTPMEWKHLGRELAAALDGEGADDSPRAAAIAFREALRLQAERRIEGARDAFRRAAAIDPEYRHPFRTPGHVYRHLGRAADAEASFRQALELDPDDEWARLGLAMLALDRQQPAEALAMLPAALSMARSLDWWRTRGASLAQLGDLSGAIDAHTRALSLATEGAVPLHMRTANRDRRLVDPAHWDDHAALAALHERAGDARLARVHWLMARAALGRPRSGVVGS